MRILRRSVCVFLLAVLIVSGVGIQPARADAHLPPPSGPSLYEPFDYPLVPMQPSPAPADRLGATQTSPDPIITNPLLDMKVLVLLDSGIAEGINQMITGYLDILGIPYDVKDVNGRDPGDTEPTIFTESDLWDGVHHGHYYAIFVATNGVWSPWIEVDGLNQAERDLIDDYERRFDVRRITWYAYPSALEHGLKDVTPTTPYTYTDPLTVSLTTTGAEVFDYLKPDVTMTLTGTYAYRSEPVPLENASVDPLLVDEDDNTVLAIFNRADGRQQMVMTVSGYYPVNPPLSIHAITLPYGMINWATKGIFLGERHLYFTPQPDDLLSYGDRWDPVNHETIYDQGYRLEPDDLDNLIGWMHTLTSTVPNAADFKVELPFNGQGSVIYDRHGGIPQGAIKEGSLTEKVVELEDQFVWLNHTYEHLDLTDVSYEVARREIVSNTQVAQALGFSDYVTTTLLTGAYTGLTNTNVISAAYDAGVRYMLSNASIPEYDNPSPNTGLTPYLQTDLLLVPRNANNIFYYASTPAEETDYYNWLYCEDPDYLATKTSENPEYCWSYDEVLDIITNQSLRFLLEFSVNATMFHMNNLNNYTGTRTLMGDFVDSLYGKYNELYDTDVPILSPPTQEIGEKMWERMAYDDSGVQGIIACGDTITLTTTNTARIPVTGINYFGPQTAYTETYAGQHISYFEMGASDTLVVPGDPVVTAAKPTGLTVTDTAEGTKISWDPVTTDTNGDPIDILTYVVYGDGVEIGRTASTTYTDTVGASLYAVTAIGDNCWKLESDPVDNAPEVDEVYMQYLPLVLRQPAEAQAPIGSVSQPAAWVRRPIGGGAR